MGGSKNTCLIQHMAERGGAKSEQDTEKGKVALGHSPD